MLITPSYLEQQKALHATGQYGTTGELFGPFVNDVAKRYCVSELLDYGCGSRQSLRKTLAPEIKYHGYDPCVDEYSADPQPAEMVACIDVMEHIEPEFIDQTIERMRELTKRIALVTVHTGPANKFLSDGRNAHIVQQPARWWLPRFCRHFDLEAYGKIKRGFYMVLA